MMFSIHTHSKGLAARGYKLSKIIFAVQTKQKNQSDSGFVFRLVGGALEGIFLMEGRKVSHVFPDSGLNWAVWPGIEGI
jgi:hypothetical protein